MINLHVHTDRCGHASGNARDFASAAVTAGVTILGFTDHLPLPNGFSRDYAMPESELDDYIADVNELKAEAAADPSLPHIVLGIEADWLPDHREHVDRLLAGHEFDVILGSVHFLDGWAFDDPRLVERYEGADIDAMWVRYFEILAEAAASGTFDVIAHPDLIKKFGHEPHKDPIPLYEEAAAAIAAAGLTIEVNTAGLRKPCKELYPDERFLAACRRAGVRATVGSDAHNPEEVGMGLAEAYATLGRVGYTSVTTFERREPREVPLG